MKPPAAHHLQVGFEKSSFIALLNNVNIDFLSGWSAYAINSSSVFGLFHFPLSGL